MSYAKACKLLIFLIILCVICVLIWDACIMHQLGRIDHARTDACIVLLFISLCFGVNRYAE